MPKEKVSSEEKPFLDLALIVLKKQLCPKETMEASENRKSVLHGDGDADEDSIPLADDDPAALVVDDDDYSYQSEAHQRASKWRRGCESLDSIPSMISDSLPTSAGPNSLVTDAACHMSEQMNRMCLDSDFSPDDAEEKARLISQVLELQNTLDDLTNRVDAVKEENLKLRSENSVLGQYIENLMQASAVFQAVSPKSGRKERPISTTNLGTVIRCTARAVRGATSSSSPGGSSSRHPS